MQGDRAFVVYLLSFLSPKAHLAERVAEACDGHPYMLWTSHEDRTWTLWKFTKHALISYVGYDQMVLLQHGFT